LFGGALLTPRKISPRIEYRLRQRDRIQNSVSIAEKFPRLNAVTLDLIFYGPNGITKCQEMKCKLNLEHSKSMLCYPCPGGECTAGDFDLSEVLAKIVAEERTTAVGEMRCHGERKLPNCDPTPCRALLRYKLTLAYD
jgi:hypothetical protein